MVDLKSLRLTSEEDANILLTAANNYYNGRETGITDLEYDTIMDRVKTERPDFNIFDYVKYDVDSEHGVHPLTIPTFQKVNYDTLSSEWNEDLVLTPKYDGCSIVAYYTNGELQNILTRSDESTGIVQTNKLKGKVPNVVDPEIRAILFEALTPEHRSAANGLVNSKYKQDEVDSKLRLRPFDCVLTSRCLGYIDRMNLTGLDYTVLTVAESLSLRGQGDEPKLYVEDWDIEVPVDGIVAYSKTRGEFGKIYKFYVTEAKVSTVTNLKFEQSSDTGIVNITAEFEPVRIGSINVKKVGNVGSWDTVKEKKLGVGSEVKVLLTKMTIPYITSNTPWKEIPRPICNWCNLPLSDFQGKLICENPECGFWVDYFATRYFNIMREVKSSDWVDEVTVKGKFGFSTLVRAEKLSGVTFSSLLVKPKYLMYVLKPPRLTGKAWDKRWEEFQFAIKREQPQNTLELEKVFCSVLTTSQQREYVELIWDILKKLLVKLSQARREIDN